ncbi:Serine/threonine phosphatase stp [Enhygromyxa salina]|uniref:Serine/threonine phosphatase stp n=1 Tax=Enhygromyxa salina TaxID=215803 RepID=A0A2S9YJU9_9BACT|nr:protein phosphatase 2C domain-containing protein [Enhygromyxa salina]PRQ05374.1 Serine/threonine phosphatase stp [Enhygromyxa salina]
MTQTIHASGRSITGRRRRNEDAYLVDPERHVFAVLDGMGGEAGGEVASTVAAEAIADFYRTIATDPQATWPYPLDLGRTLLENQLDAAIRLANRRIRAQRCDELASMGTTVASLALSDADRCCARLAALGHVGDSRVYLLRDGSLTQLTRDHSLYEQLRADGVPLPPLSEFIHANVITRALGPSEDERPELSRVKLYPGDRFLLCTDGLSGGLGSSSITELLSQGTVDEAAEALVDAAFEAGSRDNITAIVVEAPG